jgi:hypothetical protein
MPLRHKLRAGGEAEILEDVEELDIDEIEEAAVRKYRGLR